MSLENFKTFVKSRPDLINYVRKKEATWQDFYDMYELYGEDNNVWNKYLNNSSQVSNMSLKDIFSSIGNVNMGELQKGITSLQKGINYLQELVKDKPEIPEVRKTSYEPRPIHKHLDD